MITLLSIVLATVLQGQADIKLPPYTGPKKRAAVPGFVAKVDAISVAALMPSGQFGSANIPLDITGPMGFGDGMADMLNTALIDSQRFVVLERKDLKDVLDEIGQSTPDPNGAAAAAATGATTTPPAHLIDPATAPKPGRLLGAQILIRGALTELSYSKSEKGAGGGILTAALNTDSMTFTAICGIDLKVIEVETGRILDSVHTEGRAESKAKTLDLEVGGIRFGQQKFEASPLAKAIRAAIDLGVKQICKRLDEIPWEARVASVSASNKKTLYLNFGTDVGIKVGTELEVFRPGAVVTDPETKLVIGREDDTVLGRCTVVRATKTMTVATLTMDADVAPEDGVRLVKAPPG